MLISIVTINYNDAIGLEKTIISVKEQSYKNIEFIIIDGCSMDESAQVIEENCCTISISIIESDDGIYDAMNKGIKRATGDFVIFMNSGDKFFSNNIIENFVNSVKKKKEKIYFGKAKIIYDKGDRIYPSPKYNKNNISKWLKNNLPNHQAMFFPRKFYFKNYYNLKYPISADADYKFRGKAELGFEFLDTIICEFHIGGTSSTFDSFKKVKLIIIESWLIHNKYEGVKKSLERIFFILSKYILTKINVNFLYTLAKKIKD